MPGSRVADFGAGGCYFREKLPSDCILTEFDRVQYDEKVVLMDFNNDGFPVGNFDYVVCLGLIEYLENVSLFFEKLNEICKFALISYHCLKNNNTGRFNFYSHDEVEQIIRSAGFSVIRTNEIGHECFFFCSNVVRY